MSLMKAQIGRAAMSAAQFKLSNVVVLADVNKCMIDGRVDER